jgi:serine/threonine protein kinase
VQATPIRRTDSATSELNRRRLLARASGAELGPRDAGRGRTLGQVLSDVHGANDRKALFDHWMAIGDALAAVHATGSIHRDVNPDNAVLGDDGRVRLIDSITGTAGYSAPEQHKGRSVDARADQYAFCACLWEALTSARPRREADKSLVLPRAAMLSPSLVRVLRRGLSERPEDRYPCMAELLLALERIAARRR